MSVQEPTHQSAQEVRVLSQASAVAQAQATTGAHSAQLVQRLLDGAAYFNLYASPESEHRSQSSPTGQVSNNAGLTIGFSLQERLHRFEIVMQGPTVDSGLRASNIIGEQIGSFMSDWLLCPDDFQALPWLKPPPTILRPNRQQRFVMLGGDCSLGKDGDGFSSFGTGSTFPSATGSLLAAGVGNVMEGRGRLRGLVGTYTCCGSLNETDGFRGNLMLRVMDPQGLIQTDCTLPPIAAGQAPEPGVTYLIFRGQARETDKVTPLNDSRGKPEGLNVAQQLKLFHCDASAGDRGGLRTTNGTGQGIGEIDAQIVFNPAAPGGNALDPIPYTAFDEFAFVTPEGRSIGSLFIDEGEGRTFHLQLPGAPGQPAIRFGGFGPVLRATGCLEGLAGLMTDNSVVSFTPHVSASVYVIRVDDRDGRYRLGDGWGGA